MTKAGEEAVLAEVRAIREAIEVWATRIVDALFPTPGGQGGGDTAVLALQAPSTAAPANPLPTMNPMPWTRDILGRPVQPLAVPSSAVSPPLAPGPFYEQYLCPMCHNMREWRMNRARWPNAVCADCFRGLRGTR